MKKNVCRIVALVAVVSTLLLVAWTYSVEWINEGRKALNIDPCTYNEEIKIQVSTNKIVEFGLRSDGVVVWKECD